MLWRAARVLGNHDRDVPALGRAVRRVASRHTKDCRRGARVGTRADEVFAGATLTVEDDRESYGEDRFITIGFLDATMVVLVWTPRDGAHRIINMRKANERERTLYGPRFSTGRCSRSFCRWLAGEVRSGDRSPGPAIALFLSDPYTCKKGKGQIPHRRAGSLGRRDKAP